MKKLNRYAIVTVLAVASVLGIAGLTMTPPIAHAAQAKVDLQTAAPFAILAGTPNITDVANSSVITGNVGLSPASGAGIGLICSQVTGTIYTVNAAGPACRVQDGPLLVTAKNHLTAAFTDAAGRTPVTTVPTELGGTTKTAGVYDSGSTTFQITAGAGPLVIDGQGDPNAVFIFEMGFSGTGLTVGPGSTISLINQAQACNIFWRVDTATINTTAVFKGNILALNSITVANGANIEGRLLARNGNVTLNNDTIRVPSTCATTVSSSSSSSTTAAVPALPNTGVAPTKGVHSASWSVLAAVGFVVVLSSSLYLARKKRAM